MTLANITKTYLQAKEALEQAEQALQKATESVKEALAKNGVSFTIVDGVKVALTEAERPKYDAEALAQLVKPALYKQVTKTEVDGKKFKAALELGTIKPEVAEAVTTVTSYAYLRVTEVAKAKAEAPAKVTKVA